MITTDTTRGRNGVISGGVPAFHSMNLIEQLNFLQKKRDNKKENNTFRKKFTFSSNLSEIPEDVLTDYIKKEFDYNIRFKEIHWNNRKASTEQLRLDIAVSDFFETYSPKLHTNLLIRAIIGHAREGHVHFQGEKFPNTTLADVINDDVLKGKYQSAASYLDETQSFINSIAEFLIGAINSNHKTINFRSPDGQPLLGMNFLADLKFDTLALLKGFYFGAHFDNYAEIRSAAEDRYGINYGGGVSRLINKDLVMRSGIHLDQFKTWDYNDPLLRSQSSFKLLDAFEKSGLFLPDKEVYYSDYNSWNDLIENEGTNNSKDNNIVMEYFKTVKGRGGSDDVLIRLASFIDFDSHFKQKDASWYMGLQLGAGLADWVDTYEKATTYYIPGGQDETMAKFLQAKWISRVRRDANYRKMHNIKPYNSYDGHILVNKDQLIKLTGLGINPKGGAIHSSARYFLRLQKIDPDDLGNITLNGFEQINTAIDSNCCFTKNEDSDESIYLPKTTSFHQELIYMQLKLDNLGCKIRNPDGSFPIKGKLALNSEILVGFEKRPLKHFVNHMDNNVIPYALKAMKAEPNKGDEIIADSFK